MSNSSNKRPTKSQRPRKQGPLRRGPSRFGLNPVLLVASIFLIGFAFFGSTVAVSNSNEVSLSEFVQNLKSNEYSVLDIKDDGTAEVKPKYIYINETGVELDLARRDNTSYADLETGVREVGLNEFVDTIKPRDILAQLFDNSQAAGAFSELIVGENYILAVQLVSDADHLLLKNVTEKEFREYLNAEELTLSGLGLSVSRTQSASKAVDPGFIEAANDSDQLSVVYSLGDLLLVRVKESRITNDVVTWDFRVTEGLANYLRDQGVDLDSGDIEFGFLSVPSINWGDVLSLVMIAVAIVFAFFLLRGLQSGGSGLMKFGQTKAKMLFGVKPDTTFKDVAGVEEAKEELVEIVQFLRDPNRFLKMGARIPKGVLMVGPPGTGKTLLARAIAGEAGVPFFHTSGSEFEEMLVGAGASRVRDLFDKAKKSAPALIFIDEIDAVARKRGTTIQSSTTEQTLNQILTEMDGFEKNISVIVIAATNRPDVLDPAILRPGRFDRRVVIELPDSEGRKQILDIHAKNKPLAAEVNLDKLAKRTVGFSGAELENTLNEAAIIAAKAGRSEIGAKDIEEAANKTTMGPAKRSRQRTERELRLVAVHEAGHAVVSRFADESDPVHRVSIVSRGMAGGVTQFLPKSDENVITRTKLFSKIMVALGGRAAEDIVLGDISTGASSDIEHATRIARQMVQKFGMSEKLGLIKYGESNELQYLGYGYGEQRDYSDDTAKIIDEEVRHLVKNAYGQVLNILKDHRDKLDKLTEILLEQEVVEGEEFDKLFE